MLAKFFPKRKSKGLTLEPHKDEAIAKTLYHMPVSDKLYCGLYLKTEGILEASVEPGDIVQQGDVIASNVNNDFHMISPQAATVVAISNHPYLHPSGLTCPTIILEPTQNINRNTLTPLASETLTVDALRARCIKAGLVGLGGASFPSEKKITNAIDTLLINGVECEPYISCDHALMVNHTEDILKSIQLIKNTFNVKRCILAIEDDKPKVIAEFEALQSAYPGIEIQSIQTKYPSGDVKQLIYLTTGTKLNKTQHANDHGMLCYNVATVYNMYRAIVFGEVLHQRIVTVTGDAVSAPKNIMVPLGTPVGDVLAYAGITVRDELQVTAGGAMMQTPIEDMATPVTPSCQCLLVQKEKKKPVVSECIRCGKCYDACPVKILPQEIYWYAKKKQLAPMEKLNLNHCIECGCCDEVCPSNLPLVDYIRMAKSEIKAEKTEAVKQQRTKTLHELRDKRLEEEAKLLKARREARKKPVTKNAKRDAILAAVNRAKEKRSQKDLDA